MERLEECSRYGESMSRLSVIIPLHNQANSIAGALDSLKAQAFPMEIIVVDDASTDGGVEIVRDWKKKNGLELEILSLPARRHALQARICGVKAAASDNILFLDADDEITGSLEKVLEFKIAQDVEIAHFRSFAISGEGEEQGEYLLNAPFSQKKLEKASIFEGYLAKSYPPVMLWGKIYSRSLLERILPFAENEKIFRFDDKFLVSLAMLFAISYAGCNEYCYRYKLSTSWPLEKFAGRVHDLGAMRKVFEALLQDGNIPQETARAFLSFLDRRLTVNMGSLCSLMEEEFQSGQKPEAVLERILQFMDTEELFALLLKGSIANVSGLCAIIDRIHHDF